MDVCISWDILGYPDIFGYLGYLYIMGYTRIMRYKGISEDIRDFRISWDVVEDVV